MGLLLLILSGCKEEKSTVYSERIALLPDASGYLTKELRTWGKTRSELAIAEVRKSGTREVYVIALEGIDDVKFKSLTRQDTIRLFHTESDLGKAVTAVNASSFPIRLESLGGAGWISSGTLEGDPIFYAEDKWEKALQLMNQD